MSLTSIGILPIACAASVWKKTLCSRQISPVIKTQKQKNPALSHLIVTIPVMPTMNLKQQFIARTSSEASKEEMGAIMFLLQ